MTSVHTHLINNLVLSLILVSEIMSLLDEQVEHLSQKVLMTLEKTSLSEFSKSTDVSKILHLTDAPSAKKLVNEVDRASTQSEKNAEKIAIVKALLYSSWLQRLYFIIRSGFMGFLSGVINIVFILFLGPINLVDSLILSVVCFLFSLVITRLFEGKIDSATTKLIASLSKYEGVRNIVLNHL